MKKILLITVIAISISACKNEPVKNKTQLPSWLLGTWESKFDDSTVFTEKWNVLNDSVYQGEGMVLKGKDTLFTEKLQIRRERDTLYYVPTVSDQNEGKPVLFKFIRLDSSEFTAVNPAHDFPKTIEYKVKKDSVYAILTGDENGKERREVFRMKKK